MDNPIHSTQSAALMFVMALFISGCSGSSDALPTDPGVTDNQSINNTTTVASQLATPQASTTQASTTQASITPTSTPPASITPASITPISTPSASQVAPSNDAQSIPDESESAPDAVVRVDFAITVPAVQSNELQVRLDWGDISTTAAWVLDESWLVSETLTADTEHPLTIIFSDGNGAITLATVETTFATGLQATQRIQISADQFNSQRWDDDNDGITNLDALRTQNDLNNNIPPQAVQPSLALIPDKTFRLAWEPSVDSQFYRVLENPNGISGFTQIGEDINATQHYYEHRVALYKRLNASYIVQACNTTACVDSQTVTVPDSLSQAVGYFKATTDEPIGIGWHLALSSDGSTMAVSDKNAVYVFSRVDGTWEQQARMDEAGTIDNLEASMSLSDNGNVLAVGTPLVHLQRAEGEAFQSGDRRAGAVHLYHRDNGQWDYRGRLNYDNYQGGHQFGTSVSLTTDGSTLAVSAPLASFTQNDETQYGIVYFFTRNGDQWQQQSRLTGDGGNFGSSMSFSHDGNTLAVGARFHESSGSAYVFSKTDVGWLQQAVLKADDADINDQFGSSIAIDATGNTIAVGAPYFNFGDPSLAGPIGAAYVFRNTDGNWQQETRQNATWQGDQFGRDVALSGDGNLLMVTSEGASNKGIGLVYMYAWTDNIWLEQTRIMASNPDRRDRFAHSIELSHDGDTLVVGAPGEESSTQGINGDQEDDSTGNLGAVYLF